jgi:linoleoyl-CoA desaturase
MPGWLALSWLVLVVGPQGPVPAVLGITSAGLALAGGLMAVAHDHLHRRGLRPTAPTRVLVALLIPAGLSDVWWVEKHNGAHHGATGVPGHDTDLDYGSLLRLADGQAWRPWHRLQAVYAPLLYPLALLAMIWAQWRFLATGRLSNGRVASAGPSARAFGFALSLVPPLIWLAPAFVLRPAPAVLLAALGVLLVAGLTLAAVFQVEHQIAGVVAHQPDHQGRMGCDWLTAQLEGSADVATHRRLTTFYVGALNHHVEHHLFPRVPVADLPRLAPIVRRTAEEFGLRVNEHRTFVAAWADHLRFLYRLGRRPAVGAASTVALAGSAPGV